MAVLIPSHRRSDKAYDYLVPEFAEAIDGNDTAAAFETAFREHIIPRLKQALMDYDYAAAYRMMFKPSQMCMQKTYRNMNPEWHAVVERLQPEVAALCLNSLSRMTEQSPDLFRLKGGEMIEMPFVDSELLQARYIEAANYFRQEGMPLIALYAAARADYLAATRTELNETVPRRLPPGYPVVNAELLKECGKIDPIVTAEVGWRLIQRLGALLTSAARRKAIALIDVVLSNFIDLYPAVKEKNPAFARHAATGQLLGMSISNLEGGRKIDTATTRRLTGKVTDFIDREFGITNLAEEAQPAFQGLGIASIEQCRTVNLYGQLLRTWGTREVQASEEFRKKIVTVYLNAVRPFLRRELEIPQEYRRKRHIDIHSPLAELLARDGIYQRQIPAVETLARWRLVADEVLESAMIYRDLIFNPAEKPIAPKTDDPMARKPMPIEWRGLLTCLENVHVYGAILTGQAEDLGERANRAWIIMREWYLSLLETGHGEEFNSAISRYLSSGRGMALLQPHHKDAINSMIGLLREVELSYPELFGELATQLARPPMFDRRYFEKTAIGKAACHESLVIRRAINNRPPEGRHLRFGDGGL